MVDVCEIIKVLLKYKRINTDNNVFRLHYKFTVILLLLFSFLVTSKQYFGDPIDCDTGGQEKYIMDTYCWIHSTFTIKRHLRGEIGKNHIAPGVGPSGPLISSSGNDEIIKHKYYQWVCIVLFLQAIIFYIPRYLWKIWENGRLEMLVKDLGVPVLSTSWNSNLKDYLLKYLLSNSYAHNIYAVRYTICEILNFINVTAQIFLMDWFLSGQFTTFGIAIAAFSMSDDSLETNPMLHVFPKLTKCTFPNYGPSGTPQFFDALCVLPLNVVNEKLYIILWVWFYVLAIISFFALIYRIFCLTNTTVRSYILMGQVRYLNKKTAYAIAKNISFGDWFMLYQIGKNINPIILNELVNDLGHRVITKKNMNINAFAGVRV